MPRTDGRETLERARCAHSGKEALSVSQEHKWSRLRGSGPKRKGKGRKGRESVAAAQQGKHLARGHSRTRF